jgi:hypothetical protein
MSGGEDSGSDGLGDNTYPSLWWPELTKADERQIKMEFFIPRSVKLHFDDERKGAIVHVDAHEVCPYEIVTPRSTARHPSYVPPRHDLPEITFLVVMRNFNRRLYRDYGI